MQDMDLTTQVFIFHILNLNYFISCFIFFYKRLSFMKFSLLNYCNRKGVP